VGALEVEVLDEAASVGARPKMVVERRMRASADRNRLHVAADTPVNEHRAALDLAAVEAEEAVFRLVLKMLMFAMRLHVM
jgi:hypothetical protein